jgi:putative phosphoesterase
MLLGVISDTHDNLLKINKAVRLFNKKKVGYVFHLGDYVAPFSCALLNKLKCPWQGVFGNNDGEKEGLLKISAGKIAIPPLRITLDNKKITLVHDINTIQIEKENADIILFGHTHKIEIKKNKNILLLNPGEACGWLSGVSSVALLNLVDLTYKIIKL